MPKSKARSHRPSDVSAARRWWQGAWCAGLLLGALTIAAYLPALRGDFIWDDGDHIIENNALRSLQGLRDIWLEPGATMQYYPLSFTGFWAGFQLWGLNPLGYHLLTLVLHVCVSLLLWLVLDGLKFRAAWLAAAIFALHPVNTMSVAWVTELKNTLSGSLVLLAAWAYLRHACLGIYETVRPIKGFEGWRFGAVSVALFLLAMFAKTAVSFLPATLFLVLWWQNARVTWNRLWPLFAMLMIAALMSRLTFAVEHLYGARGQEFTLPMLERILVSGKSFWVCLGKVVFPFNLSFIYERWEVNPEQGWQYIYPVGLLGLLAGCWLMRHRVGKGLFVGFTHYYITTSFLVLLQVLYMMRYTWVTDHWQYYGMMGMAALLAGGLAALAGSLQKHLTVQPPILIGVVLLALGVLTWRQAGIYRNVETLWRDTVAKNPGAWMAWNNLGLYYFEQGRFDDAAEQYHAALRAKPDCVEAQSNLGQLALSQGRVDEAIQLLVRARRMDPGYPDALNHLGSALLAKGRTDEAIEAFRDVVAANPKNASAFNNLGAALAQSDRLSEALTCYQTALQLKPDHAMTRLNLATTFFQLGRTNEAFIEFNEAVRRQPDDPRFRLQFARALAMTGRRGEAAIQLREVLRLSPDDPVAREQLKTLERVAD